MLGRVKDSLAGTGKSAAAWLLGREPRLHRIPFGPLKGRQIFISFEISPRMYLGIHERWAVSLASERAKAGDVVYDVGAHIGYMSLLFAQTVGSTGAVHSFEIIPSVAETFLRRTVEANPFTNVVIHNVGISNVEESLELPVGPRQMTSLDYRAMQGQTMERCNAVRLDDYVSRQGLPVPDLIKIDAEGAEIGCLEGGEELIRSRRPEMIIEFHTPRLLALGYERLRSWDYRLVTRSHGTLTPQILSQTDSFREPVLCLPE